MLACNATFVKTIITNEYITKNFREDVITIYSENMHKDVPIYDTIRLIDANFLFLLLRGLIGSQGAAIVKSILWLMF